MALNETLLKIKREFSREEKYRMLIAHYNQVEDSLAAEIKKGNELLKKTKELEKRIKELEAENRDFRAGGVSLKAHTKLATKKAEWENRFWDQNRELKELKEKYESDKHKEV